MLENEEIDGVGIAGQPDLQDEAGMFYLEKGIPILIEKPIATIVEAAYKMVKTAEERNTFGMTASTNRFHFK